MENAIKNNSIEQSFDTNKNGEEADQIYCKKIN